MPLKKYKPEIENEFLELMAIDCKTIWHRYSIEECDELLETVENYIDYVESLKKNFTPTFFGSALGKLNAIRSVALSAKKKE